MTTFSTILPFEDYLAACRLMTIHSWFWKGAARFVLIVGAIYSAIVGFAFMSDDGFKLWSLITASAGGFGFAMVVAALCFAVQWLLLPRRARKSFKQMQIEGHTTSYSFDEAGMHVENPHGTSNYTWQHFVRWRENRRILLIYRTDLLILPIPKNSVDTAVIDALRTRLREAGVPTR